MGNPNCLCLLLLDCLLSALSLLTSTLNFICTLFCPAAQALPDPTEPEPEPEPEHESESLSTSLICELLPVSKYSELTDPPHQSCAVCLHDFADCDIIRRLTNCCHVFHRTCLDRWMEYDQKTCPLCRMLIIPNDVGLQQEAINETLWAACGIFQTYRAYLSDSW